MRHRLQPLPLQLLGCRLPLLLKPKHAWMLAHWAHTELPEAPPTTVFTWYVTPQ